MQLNTLSMVHEFLRRTVKPGDFCIDATAGKGRDTALLCRLTGDAGRVLAFDIQEAAVAQTKALLAAEGLTAEVIRDSHANMERYAAAETVDCVVLAGLWRGARGMQSSRAFMTSSVMRTDLLKASPQCTTR